MRYGAIVIALGLAGPQYWYNMSLWTYTQPLKGEREQIFVKEIVAGSVRHRQLIKVRSFGHAYSYRSIRGIPWVYSDNSCSIIFG